MDIWVGIWEMVLDFEFDILWLFYFVVFYQNFQFVKYFIKNYLDFVFLMVYIYDFLCLYVVLKFMRKVVLGIINDVNIQELRNGLYYLLWYNNRIWLQIGWMKCIVDG